MIISSAKSVKLLAPLCKPLNPNSNMNYFILDGGIIFLGYVNSTLMFDCEIFAEPLSKT